MMKTIVPKVSLTLTCLAAAITILGATIPARAQQRTYDPFAAAPAPVTTTAPSAAPGEPVAAVTSDSAAAALPPPPSLVAAPGHPDSSVIASLEFVDTPITTVFKMISDLTGWSIVMSPDVSKQPPKINIWIKNLTPDEVLQRVVGLTGLVAERKNNVVQVMTFDEYGKLRGLEKRVVTLRNARVRDVASMLQALVDKEQSRVLTDESSNKLVLLVPQPLLDSLMKLVETLDVPFEKDTIKVIHLTNLQARDIVPKLEQFLTQAAHGADRNADRGDNRTLSAPPGTPPPPGGAPAAPAAPTPAADAAQTTRAGNSYLVQFMIESKLNVIVLRGLPSDVEQATQLITQLDVPNDTNVLSRQLKYTNARDAFATLQQLVAFEQRDQQSGRSAGGSGQGDSEPRLRIGVSEQNNQIVIEGSAADRQRVQRLVEAIDQPLAADAGGIRVYRLENATADEVASALNDLVHGGSGSSQGSPPSIAGIHPAPGPSGGPGTYGSSPPASLAPSSSGGASASAAPAGAVPTGGPTGAPAGAGGAPGTAPANPGLFPVQITSAPDINAVLVRASAADQETFSSVIRSLDEPRQQVLLEVTLVTVRNNNDFNLGVEVGAAGVQNGTNTIGFSTFGIGTPDPSTGAIRISNPAKFGLNFAVFNSNDFSLVLNALKTVGQTRISSAPRTLVQDNAQAQISQTNQEPYTQVSQGQSSTLTSFGGFVEAGTVLKVVPHISKESWLRLEYEVDLSAFGSRTAQQLAANLPPPRRESKSSGTVRVPNEYTVVIGGLVTTLASDTVDSIPFAANVPLLGELFKNRSQTKINETLFIFIRPVVVRDPAFRDLISLSTGDIHRAGLFFREQPMNALKLLTPPQSRKAPTP
jgi:general secretion pathway protein D